MKNMIFQAMSITDFTVKNTMQYECKKRSKKYTQKGRATLALAFVLKLKLWPKTHLLLT